MREVGGMEGMEERDKDLFVEMFEGDSMMVEVLEQNEVQEPPIVDTIIDED